MPLDVLRIYNARNIKELSLDLYPSFNIFYGSNGSGKTTILESVYLLLRSRTFRTSKYKTFINHESDQCTVFSRFTSRHVSSDLKKDKNVNSNSDFTLAISRSKDTTQPIVKYNSEKIFSISSINRLVLLGLITPESFNLLDAGPSVRRKFIDWGVFHVEPNFIQTWKAYKKIINNRNNQLRKLNLFSHFREIPEHELNALNCWSPQLITLNETLSHYRKKQLSNIKPIFYELLRKFSEDLADNIKISYYQGWTKELEFKDYLSNKLSEDIKSGTTRFGSHRSELRINYKNQLAKDILSRGQKKVIVLCLILSQFTYLSKQKDSAQHQLLLLDDIDSELDEHNLFIFLEHIKTLSCQKLITTTNKNKYNFISSVQDSTSRMFHVKQQ